MLAPKSIKCKMCNNRFSNPVRKKSSIVIVTCDPCRQSMFSAKTIRRQKRQAAAQKKKPVEATKQAPKTRKVKVKESTPKETVKKTPQRKAKITLNSFRS